MMADLADVNDGTVSLTSPSADSMTVTGDLTVDTSTLKVDSTNNRVGIGTALPDSTLSIENTTSSGATIKYDGQSNTEFGLRIQSNVSGGNFESDFAAGGTALLDLFANSSTTSGGDFLVARTQASNPVLLVKGNGRVGIGTTLPVGHGGFASGRIVEVKNSGNADSGADNSTISITSSNRHAGLSLESGAARNGYIQFGDPDDDDVGGITYAHATNALTFKTNALERMRITTFSSLGHLLINTTADTTGFIHINTDSTADAVAMRFKQDGVTVGSITCTGSATSFNTSSDYRLKENVTGITDGITRVKQLNPSRFNFISDPDTAVDGFLAHEAQTVVPEAVNGTQDAMRDEEYEVTPATGDIFTPASAATDEVVHSTNVEQPDELADGQEWRETTAAVMGTRSVPDYQGIDQSKLVPLLTAALQEAIAKIETLETKNATQATQIADLITRVTALEAN
jgi:hypothetical protein